MKTFVLFDIDGTLLYSNSIDSRCFADSYKSVFGRPFPTIDWRQFPHVTDYVIFRTAFHAHFGRYATVDERTDFETHYLASLQRKRAENPEEFLEVPGAKKLWNHLKEDERFIPGIATGGWKNPATIKLAHVGIDTDWPYAAYANGMPTRNHILGRAIELVREDHEIGRIVYVGDAVWDATTTREMGLPMIGVRRKGDHEVLRREGVELVLENYLPMGRFLEGLYPSEG